MLLKQIIFKSKIIKQYFGILFNKLRLGAIQIDENVKIVYFDLNERNAERYYFSLIYFFYESGYNILVKNNFAFIGSCLGDGKRLFSIPSLSIVNSCPSNPNVIFFTDRPIIATNDNNWKKVFVVNFNVYDYVEKDDHLLLPFPMSPSNYKINKKTELSELRCKKRRIGAFFSGNTNKRNYTNSIIKYFFNKVNRFEVIETLKSCLSEQELIIQGNKQVQDLNPDLLKKFVLVDWQWSHQASYNLKERIDNEKWLDTLANSNFFLACPGVTMPMCHNIVEAMAVGTIPITEYPEFFHPPLVHKQNCIVYNGKEDLVLKVKEALHLEQDEIQEMKSNVINYYDENLSPESFVDKVESISSKFNVLYMNGENVSLLSHAPDLVRAGL